MAVSGISTLGILFGYAAETTAGTKPSTFKALSRIVSIGEIKLDEERLDSTTLEDTVKKYIAGIADTGGSFDVVVNLTDDTQAEWEDVISIYNALTGGKQMWFETYSPYLSDAFYVVAQPPKVIGQPSTDQNGVWQFTMSLTINEYKGLDTAIKPTVNPASA